MDRDNRRKYRIWIPIALGHLVLVALGAAYVDYSGWNVVGSPLGYYGMASGAGNSYGFFAPGISGQLRARFEVLDARGVTHRVGLTESHSHEASLRVGNIIDQFADDEDDGDEEASSLHRSLSASLAGTVFGRHPEARKVVVRFEQFLPVSMTEYRRGIRPQWSQLYAATFTKAKGESRR